MYDSNVLLILWPHRPLPPLPSLVWQSKLDSVHKAKHRGRAKLLDTILKPQHRGWELRVIGLYLRDLNTGALRAVKAALVDKVHKPVNRCDAYFPPHADCTVAVVTPWQGRGRHRLVCWRSERKAVVRGRGGTDLRLSVGYAVPQPQVR